MANLSRQIEAEKENIEGTLANLANAMKRREKSVIELAAIATFLHNIYNGVENILKQVLKAKNITIPKSEIWHKELLDLSVSYKIIPESLADELREYLAFRHFFVHGYGFMLEKAPLERLANNIPNIWSQFFSKIETLVRPKNTND
ncbi:MAG: HepT-like ribonuclease domain-containing protein [Candidatus Aerophobetes bacterium]|nr:HepT-like ribonuclease domain-containing protein [Candidatus Aerophobetes bacterium]